MPDPYILDCSGFCRSVWELYPPDSYVFVGLVPLWLYEEGWTRSLTGAWICPDCSRQDEKDHEDETLTLTPVQVAALPTTPRAIVPAPGPGKRIVYYGFDVVNGKLIWKVENTPPYGGGS